MGPAPTEATSSAAPGVATATKLPRLTTCSGSSAPERIYTILTRLAGTYWVSQRRERRNSSDFAPRSEWPSLGVVVAEGLCTDVVDHGDAVAMQAAYFT